MTKEYLVTAHDGVLHVTSYLVVRGRRVTTMCGQDVVLQPAGVSFDQWVGGKIPRKWATSSTGPGTPFITCHECWIMVAGESPDKIVMTDTPCGGSSRAGQMTATYISEAADMKPCTCSQVPQNRHWIAEAMPYFAVIGVGACVGFGFYFGGLIVEWWR